MRARAVLALAASLALAVSGPAFGHDDDDDDDDRKKCKGNERSHSRSCPKPPPPPPPPQQERWVERTDARAELVVSVAPSSVDASVPPAYVLVVVNGQATLRVSARSVSQMQMDGTASRSAIVHEGSVDVIAPDGSGGVHAYLLWQVSDHGVLAQRLASLGLPSVYASASFSASSAMLGASLAGDVTGYGFRGGARESAAVSGYATRTTFWYEGRRGRVRIDVTCGPCGAPGTGAVALSANAGSRLAGYLGSSGGVTVLANTGFTRGDATVVATVPA